jgi:hypothetical protein
MNLLGLYGFAACDFLHQFRHALAQAEIGDIEHRPVRHTGDVAGVQRGVAVRADKLVIRSGEQNLALQIRPLNALAPNRHHTAQPLPGFAYGNGSPTSTKISATNVSASAFIICPPGCRLQASTMQFGRPAPVALACHPNPSLLFPIRGKTPTAGKPGGGPEKWVLRQGRMLRWRCAPRLGCCPY